MLALGQNAVGGQGLTTAAGIFTDGHSLAVDAVAFNGGIYFSLACNPGSAEKGQIDFAVVRL
jgi:hypothetical protein